MHQRRGGDGTSLEEIQQFSGDVLVSANELRMNVMDEFDENSVESVLGRMRGASDAFVVVVVFASASRLRAVSMLGSRQPRGYAAVAVS